MIRKWFRLAMPAALLAGCASTPAIDSIAARPAAGIAAPITDPAEAARLRRAAAEVLFWSQAQRDENFRKMERLFPVNRVDAGDRVRPLAAGAPLPLPPAEVDAFMSSHNVAGLLVLENGRIRLERYARGFGPEQNWTSFSVAKSLTSTLVGAALRDGSIRSLDDTVTRYVPELAGSAYDGVTLRHVLTMSSGVRWNENYADPKSDIARIFAEAPPPGKDVTIAYLARLPRAHPPGTRWNYNTAETNLVGIILGRAVRRPLAVYASEKIWRPYGMEADAFWQVNEQGLEVSGCCVSARLRDYGRIGQFMLDGGRARGRRVLPETWLTEATRAQQPFADRPGHGYGYQWWALPVGYQASGIFGQAIRVDPARRLVIVTLSAWPRATDRDLSVAREAFFQKIASAL